MNFVKKIKDILFEEEEYTEQINLKEENKEEKPKIVKIEPNEINNEVEEPKKVNKEIKSERELFKSDNSFTFPDFDEEEFVSSMSRTKQNTNVLDYEKKKNAEKREFNRYERDYKDQRDLKDVKDYSEKKKFKPSPIISPVYGILNQDYKAEDIVQKEDVASNIDIEVVRKKAFESINKAEVKKEEDTDIISEPVVTFFEEKDIPKVDEEKVDNYKTIDDLLEEASDEISLEDTLEIPKANNLDAIEEELEKIDEETKEKTKDLDDTLDSDLFELIDSMYEEREEG